MHFVLCGYFALVCAKMQFILCGYSALNCLCKDAHRCTHSHSSMQTKYHITYCYYYSNSIRLCLQFFFTFDWSLWSLLVVEMKMMLFRKSRACQGSADMASTNCSQLFHLWWAMVSSRSSFLVFLEMWKRFVACNLPATGFFFLLRVGQLCTSLTV